MKLTISEIRLEEQKRVASLMVEIENELLALDAAESIILDFEDIIQEVTFNYMNGVTIILNLGSNYRGIVSALVKKFGKFDKNIYDTNFGSSTPSDDKVFLQFESKSLEPYILLKVGNPQTCKVVYETKVIPAHTVDESTEIIASIDCKGE